MGAPIVCLVLADTEPPVTCKVLAKLLFQLHGPIIGLLGLLFCQSLVHLPGKARILFIHSARVTDCLVFSIKRTYSSDSVDLGFIKMAMG